MRIYTDGSCRKPKECGGWAFIIVDSDDDIIEEIKGYKESTTSQEMEIKAICKALDWCKNNYEVRQSIKLYSDSKYGVNGFNSWSLNWSKRDWKNSKNEIVAHVEYWKCIHQNRNAHEYTVKHIKAHRGHYFNEYVDDLCRNVWKNTIANNNHK